MLAPWHWSCGLLFVMIMDMNGSAVGSDTIRQDVQAGAKDIYVICHRRKRLLKTEVWGNNGALAPEDSLRY